MIPKTKLRFIVLFATAWVTLAPTVSNAQGIVRRIGERVRENVQQRISGSPLQPPTDPAARLNPNTPPDPAARRPAASNRANYNSPATRRSAAPVPPAPKPGLREPAAAATASGSRPLTPGSRSLLGVSVEAPPSILVPGQSPRRPRGASVVATTPGSGAEAAGLSAGDMIVSINGLVVADVDQFLRQLAALSPGQQVELKYVRQGALRVVNTVMADGNGKLNAATYADVQAMANVNTPRSQNEQNNSTNMVQPASGEELSVAPEASVFGGIGNAVGSWLGSRNASPRSQPNSVAPALKEDPFESGFEPVTQSDAEAATPAKADPPERMVDSPAPWVGKVLALDNQSDGELLPPAAKPVVSKSKSKENTPSNEEQASVKALMKEVERLQERVKQLESTSK